MPIDVKICGLNSRESVAAAVEGGASFAGFVFFPASPRSLSPVAAAGLMAEVPPAVLKVGLVVDADDGLIEEIISRTSLDILQFHGQEPPGRVAEVKKRFGREVMKAIPISAPGDIAAARAYEQAADRLLLDARPPEGATRPGGNALAFDWELIAGETWSKPWLLAGGLDAGNVGEAVRISGAVAVDVSSGVEDAPGVKNPDKIREFLAVARKI